MQVANNDEGVNDVGQFMIPDAYMEQSAVHGFRNAAENVVNPTVTAVSPFAQPPGQSLVLGQPIESGYVVVDPAIVQLPQHTGQPEMIHGVRTFEFVNYPWYLSKA